MKIKISIVILLVMMVSVPCWSAVIIGHVSGSNGTSSTGLLANADIFLDGTPFISRSDAQGNYQLENVPYGAYWLYCYHKGFWGVQISVRVYADTVLRDMCLLPDIPQGSCWEPIVKFAGKVTDTQSGNIIPNVFLRTANHIGCGKYVTWADSFGVYNWKLSVDPESLTIWAPGYQSLHMVVQAYPPDPGVIKHEQDFALSPITNKRAFSDTALMPSSLLADGYLRYSLADSVLPGPHCFLHVQVMDEMENKPLPFAYIWVHELRQGARTNQEGSFLIGPIEPGTYTVTPMKYDYFVPNNYKNFTIDVSAPKSSDAVSTAKLVLWMIQQP
jgi:hypothetical protein